MPSSVVYDTSIHDKRNKNFQDYAERGQWMGSGDVTETFIPYLSNHNRKWCVK